MGFKRDGACVSAAGYPQGCVVIASLQEAVVIELCPKPQRLLLCWMSAAEVAQGFSVE